MPIWRRIRPVIFEPLFCHRARWLSYLAGATVMNRTDWRRSLGVVEKHLCLSPVLDFTFISVRSFAAPLQAKPKPTSSEDFSFGPRINGAITAPFVRLVTDEGHGVVSRLEALDCARRLDLDLVEVQRTADPPVCKIMDFHKEKFKQEVKEKERVKSKSVVALRNGENKEIRFKPKTELKDLKMKADTITRLMERGYRVKCTAVPNGKEDEDLAGLVTRVLSLIEDVSIVESGPHVEARQAYVIVRHVKFATKKSGKKVSKVLEAASKGVPSAEHTGLDDTSLEPIDGSSAAEVEDLGDLVEAKGHSFSSALHTSKSSPRGNFSKEFNENNNKISDLRSARNCNPTGFSQSTNSLHPADRSVEPSFVKTNRYARQNESKGRLNQAIPTQRRAGIENQVFNQGRQQPSRNGREGQVQLDPRQRQSNPSNPVSPSPRYGVFISSKTASSGDANSEPKNSAIPTPSETSSTAPSYGTFSGSPNIASGEKRNTTGAAAEKPGSSSAGRTSFGIFSKPNPATSTDQRNIKDSPVVKSDNPSQSPPRYGIFSTPKSPSSSDRRN
ncbi:hypothetical protein J5N97_020292 [Dioscorea zingiberensis]|uniref:Translation initiation factor IF-3 n=1 Tax=Dioscorea zingiberensis TaxID=325984 RepID=A0A9D5HDN8_9LILI|nr:hypothetical protein J5N97_020292 [Dioscorea zingiberensis]